MEAKLRGKMPIVTGASSGAQRLCAVTLQKNANPAGFDKDPAIDTSDLIAQSGGEAIFWQTDISNVEQIQAAFVAALSTFGRIDIVVNCASYWALFRKFAEEDDELWTKMPAVNTLGTVRMNRLAMKQFLKQDVDEN
ncbi:hypothetical protein jhhlp_007888 [Lomentospora prolificans]|uniref:Uncharacterized protein n=1 Tax=Lomentospora prolificans TaxID=41688 RepID=A0A2N3N0V0_9PEZI|nr:hypothetical protein jhhlp_007888 [Lomentospora prolificans]